MCPFPWGGKASGDMVGSYGPNSDPWGCSGARVMTTFVFYVGPHCLNFKYFAIYEGLLRYMELFGGI